MRFGITISSLQEVTTTATSTGTVMSFHDSYTPLGGLVLITNIALGELIFGGVGSGLYSMIYFAIIAVFIAGLMVGRTPEYLGKKIERKEIMMAVLALLISPLLVLGFTALAMALPAGASCYQQRRAARADGGSLRLHLRQRQQRLGLRRTRQ